MVTRCLSSRGMTVKTRGSEQARVRILDRNVLSLSLSYLRHAGLVHGRTAFRIMAISCSVAFLNWIVVHSRNL